MRKKKGLYKEASGRWIYRTLEEIDGQKIEFRGTSILSAEEAKASWKRRREKKIRGMRAEKDKKERRITIEEAIQAWYGLYKQYETSRGRQRSGQTIRTDRGTISSICQDVGGVLLCDLTPEILQKDLLRLRDRGVSQSIINKRWNMLRMFLEHEMGRDNPLERCVRPCSLQTGQQDEKTAYSQEEMSKLAGILLNKWVDGVRRDHEYQGFRCGAMLVVIMYEFLRISEAIELRAGDVDLEAGIIHIQRQYQESADKVTPPKYKSIRDVPIMSEVRNILKDTAKGKKADDLLWPRWTKDRRYSKHITQGRIREDLHRACVRAGVPVHTVHDLRHDGISRVVNLGVKPQSVSRWAGHKSLSMTMDRYYRHAEAIDPDDLAKIQQKH